MACNVQYIFTLKHIYNDVWYTDTLGGRGEGLFLIGVILNKMELLSKYRQYSITDGL